MTRKLRTRQSKVWQCGFLIKVRCMRGEREKGRERKAKGAGEVKLIRVKWREGELGLQLRFVA